MGYSTLNVERAGAIATVTLNRPGARNALDLVMRAAAVDIRPGDRLDDRFQGLSGGRRVGLA